MEWLHPVTIEKKVAIDVKIAAFVTVNFSAECFENFRLVEPVIDIAEAFVTEIAVFTGDTDIIWILTGPLIGADNGIVAVDTGRDTCPDGLAIVAGLDQGLAAREGIFHGLTVRFVNDSRVAALTTSHRFIVLILGQAVGETIAN